MEEQGWSGSERSPTQVSMGEIRPQALRSGLKAPEIRRGNPVGIRFPHTMTMVEVAKEELVVKI